MKNKILLTIGIVSFTGLVWAGSINIVPSPTIALILPISLVLWIWADF